MLITKLVRNNPRGDNSIMFDFTDCAAKYLCPPWKFAVLGSNQLVTYLSMYTYCMLYNELTAVYHCMSILTSSCILVLICAASSSTDDF
jgi:hypothetical protein